MVKYVNVFVFTFIESLIKPPCLNGVFVVVLTSISSNDSHRQTTFERQQKMAMNWHVLAIVNDDRENN